MRYIGRLDREKFQGISQEIATDEVVLMEDRLEHILMRRREVYLLYQDKLTEIVENPDYILEDTGNKRHSFGDSQV